MGEIKAGSVEPKFKTWKKQFPTGSLWKEQANRFQILTDLQQEVMRHLKLTIAWITHEMANEHSVAKYIRQFYSKIPCPKPRPAMAVAAGTAQVRRRLTYGTSPSRQPPTKKRKRSLNNLFIDAEAADSGDNESDFDEAANKSDYEFIDDDEISDVVGGQPTFSQERHAPATNTWTDYLQNL